MKIKKLLAVLATVISIVLPVSAASVDEVVYNQVSQYIGEPNAGEITADILDASAYYQVDPVLITALFTAESGFQENAVSPAGAIGISQLMPGTAEYVGADPYDTRSNIFGGVAYLSEQLVRFGGDYALAEAAYNAGPGAVSAAGGIPAYAETQNYVSTVEAIRENIWDQAGWDITPSYSNEPSISTAENALNGYQNADNNIGMETYQKINKRASQVKTDAKAIDVPTGSIRFLPPSATK